MSSGQIIQARELSKEFRGPSGEAIKAVQGVDLSIEAGEVVLILGPSGSGKTTLLCLLAGIYSSTHGSVRICGSELEGMDADALQTFRLKQMGFVFQNARLINGLSAVENVELPLNMDGQERPQSRTRALELLEVVGLSHRATFAVDALSGGEKQRVSVARALALGPAVLLADEPTAMIDAEAGDVVVNALCRTARDDNAALILVGHDPRLAPHADRVLRMESGRVFKSSEVAPAIESHRREGD